MAEREEISRGLARGMSMRRIAAELGRAPSTISRELRRNGGRTAYRAQRSDERAWNAAERPKPCKIALQPKLRTLVQSKLTRLWSPEQISGWLRARYDQTVT